MTESRLKRAVIMPSGRVMFSFFGNIASAHGRFGAPPEAASCRSAIQAGVRSVTETMKAPAAFQPPFGLLLGLGLATWMEFYTYDGVNLILPDMAGSLGISQDEASWILTTYLSALLFGVPLSIWLAGHVGYLRYIIGSTVVFAIASVGCAVAPD